MFGLSRLSFLTKNVRTYWQDSTVDDSTIKEQIYQPAYNIDNMHATQERICLEKEGKKSYELRMEIFRIPVDI